MAGGVASDWLAHEWSARAGRCYLPAVALLLTGVLLMLVGSRAHEVQPRRLCWHPERGVVLVAMLLLDSHGRLCGDDAGVVSGTMNMGCQLAERSLLR